MRDARLSGCEDRSAGFGSWVAILARAVNEGYFCYPALVRDPWLNSLRGAPEFNCILKGALDRHAEAVRAFIEAGGEQVLGAVTLPGAR